MPRKAAPKPAPPADDGLVSVVVLKERAVSDGRGGHFPAQQEIRVTPEQAASLQAGGWAQ